MAIRKLIVIAKPRKGTRTIFTQPSKKTSVVLSDHGKLDLLCGKCDAVLAKSIKRGQVRNVVLQCNRCGRYNNTF